MAKKKRRGAPNKSPDDKKTETIPVKVTLSQKAEIEAAAEIAMDKTSTWARKILLQAARKLNRQSKGK